MMEVKTKDKSHKTKVLVQILESHFSFLLQICEFIDCFYDET